MSVFRSVFIVLLVSASVSGVENFCSSDKTSKLAEYHLKEELLCDYDESIRPKIEHRNETVISMDFKLQSFTYNMYVNTISTTVSFTGTWQDDHLKWNLKDYDDVTSIILNSHNIWIPDIAIFNGNTEIEEIFTDMPCRVRNTGTVECSSIVTMEAVCIANLVYYPYDSQSCTIHIGSRMSSGKDIDVQVCNRTDTLQLYFVPNPEWSTKTISLIKQTATYLNLTFPRLEFSLKIQRHSGFHGATVIAPIFILVILTLLIVFLDIFNPSRFYLNCVGLICHILYLQNVCLQLPAIGDKPPLIIVFARNSLLLNVVTMGLCEILQKVSSMRSVNMITFISKVLMENRVGRTMFYFDKLLESTPTNEEDDDKNNLIENNDEKTPDYKMFVKFLDRLFLLICFIIYLVMFITLFPY